MKNIIILMLLMCTACTSAAEDTMTNKTLYDFTLTALGGEPLPLVDYRGKAVLLVNVASKCGFTKQYADLQTVWAHYRDQGLIVLGVPSNDFGEQEPGTAADIKRTCDLFTADFPMTEKMVVSGDGAHPLYQWASAQVGFLGRPKWNFHKYLFDRQGHLQDWFGSMTKPTDKKVTQAIEAALAR